MVIRENIEIEKPDGQIEVVHLSLIHILLCEELPEELKAGITYIQVKDSEDAVGDVYKRQR